MFSLILSILVISYIVVHIPFDIYMMSKRDRSKPLFDYGINSSDRLNALMGLISIAMWLFWLANCFPNLASTLFRPPLIVNYPMVKLFGSILASIGVLLAIMARIARGKFAPSWGLNDTIPLITSGPYHWVRHPSYTFYMLMFIALPLITGYIPSLLLLAGIPVYYKISKDEERLLVHHFGEAYISYQHSTGRFVPKFS